MEEPVKFMESQSHRFSEVYFHLGSGTWDAANSVTQ